MSAVAAAPDFETGLALLEDVAWQGAAVVGERAHALLAALALAAPRPVGDGRLVEAVWSEHAPPSSTKALQVLVSRTRAQTDASLVERTANGYRLGAVPCDFRMLVEHAERPTTG